MSNKAWLCQYKNHYFTNVYALEATIPNIVDVPEYTKLKYAKEEDKQAVIREKILSFKKAWERGEYIEESNMPSKIYLQETDAELPKENELFFRIYDGYLVFNQKCYEMLKQGNLGRTHFSQIFIYEIEKEKLLLATPYYFINIAETRDFLNVDESYGIYANSYMPKLPERYIGEPKSNDIVLDSRASSCDVDLWHDPKLKHSLFFSDKFVHALLKFGITEKDLGLVSCKIK